jgi:hypothetical protein
MRQSILVDQAANKQSGQNNHDSAVVRNDNSITAWWEIHVFDGWNGIPLAIRCSDGERHEGRNLQMLPNVADPGTNYSPA